MTLTGNEVIILEKGSTDIDKIGNVGVNAPTGWALSPSGSTANHDIRRKYNVGQGDINWSTCKSEWDVFSDTSYYNLGQHQNNCGGTVSTDPLTLTIANGAISGSYYEFDVLASSSPAHYFDNCLMFIQYSHATFGDSVFVNGNTIITQYPAFSSSTYQISANDIVPDTLAIGFGTGYTGPWSRTLLGSTQPMLHVKIKIKNCGQTPNIAFEDIGFTYDFSFFTNGAGDADSSGAAQAYDTTYYSGTLNSTLNCMEITDFTQPIDAGVGSILTITGSGFGASRGNGQVKFIDADSCCSFNMPRMNAVDYLSWTDTQIEIILPAFLDTILSDKTERVSVGGGNFIVKNNAGLIDTSKLNLSGVPFSIYYNINQGWDYYYTKKNEVLLRNKNGSGGYTLRLNPTDFPPNSLKRGIFAKAMRDWICMTGVNWIIGADTSLTYTTGTAPVGTNYIFFSGSGVLNGNEAARTDLYNRECPNVAILNTGVMIFNANTTWVYDSTGTVAIPAGQEDFYGVCLHELGHLIQLRHHSDPTNLMFWTSGQGPLTPTQRQRLMINTSPTEGGLYSVTQSASNTTACTSGATVMVPQNASCTSGINSFKSNNGAIKVYPNPSSGSITIQSTIELGAIQVYDALGQIIYQQKTKENNLQIDLSNQATGIYLIKVGNNYTKVIKQ